MKVDYTNSFNFKPIPAITPLEGYWENSTWKFNMPEISAGATYTPSWQDVILSGNTALTLINAKEDGLNYLKLFGDTEFVPETYIDSVTAEGKCVQRNLPEGYTQVEYIESSGTQWIDTLVYPTEKTEAEYKCAVTGNVTGVNSHLFGSRFRANAQGFCIAYMNRDSNTLQKFRISHGSATTTETSVSVTASQLANPHSYYMSGTSFKVDGTQTLSFTTNAFTGQYSLWLFGVNNGGSLHSEVIAQRVYKCTIWDNGTLVRNLIPCRRNSDSVLGMYDTVSGQFLTNAGTGTFTAGNDIVPWQG